MRPSECVPARRKFYEHFYENTWRSCKYCSCFWNCIYVYDVLVYGAGSNE